MSNKRPLFQKRHYKAIAKLISNTPLDSVVENLAIMLHEDNPNFNIVKFFEEADLYYFAGYYKTNPIVKRERAPF